MGALNLAVELRCPRFDIRMPDTQVFNMPMELRLELMATIGSDLLDTKRELGNDVINKLAGYPAILLSVFLAHVFVEHCHEQIRL